MFFEPETTTIVQDADLLHPDDAQYVWLPIAVLVGIFFLAALVYVMSRSRCRVSLVDCWARRKAPRIGYLNVDEEDSDVPMACGDEMGDDHIAASLLVGRLHIEDRPDNRPNVA